MSSRSVSHFVSATCRVTTLLVLCATAATAQSAPNAASRLPLSFQTTRLALDLTVDYQRSAISGTATLVVRNISSQPVAQLPFLLNRLMKVKRVRLAADAPVPFSQRIAQFEDDSMKQATAVEVRLPHSIAPRDSVVLDVAYDGRLSGFVETGALYIQDHVDSAFTILREDALAFPVLGGLSDARNRKAPRTDFAFSVRLTVPSGEVVAMGGELVEKTDHGHRVTWTYRSRRAVPFLNIVIAPYREVTTSDATIFYFAEDSSGATAVATAITRAVDRLARWYGPVGDSLRLTVMEIPEGWGSQASLSAGIIETADAFRDSTQRYQLYHELSHIWNAPDRDVVSPRWNEGLASFLQWRIASELDGWHDWPTRLTRLESNLRRSCSESDACGRYPFAEYGRHSMTDLSYSVGAAFFYALFVRLGETRFDATYRTLLQTHREGVTVQDLEQAFAQVDAVAGHIVQEWLSTTRWYERIRAGESLKGIVESYGIR